MNHNRTIRYGRSTIGILLIMIINSCIISSECKGNIEEAGLYLKLEHGRGYEGHRIYISKTDSFGSDYIQFNSTEVTAPEIYYVEPDTLYVRDRDSFYVTDIKSLQFKIKHINHIYPPPLTMPCDSATYSNFRITMRNIEQIDSAIMAKSSYNIGFGDNALYFVVCNKDRACILKQATIHKLF